MPLQFEWDPKKAKANEAKHRVSFEEAITVFADLLARIFEDPEHSESERREIIIGHSVQQASDLSELYRNGRKRSIA